MTLHPIQEDDDIRRLRKRVEVSLRESQDRRRAASPIADGLSAAIIAAAIVMLVVFLVVSVVRAPQSAAAAENAGERVVVAHSRGTAGAGHIVGVVCPRPAVMTRRVCVAWLRVAQCETGDPADVGVTTSSVQRIRWRYNGASGFDGGLQFSVRTWRGNIGRVPAWRLTRFQRLERARGAYGLAWQAPPAVQMLAADALRVRPDGGLGHWPRCGARWG